MLVMLLAPAFAIQIMAAPLEIVLVEAGSVTPEMVLQWKKERFNAVAVVLDERMSAAASRQITRSI